MMGGTVVILFAAVVVALVTVALAIIVHRLDRQSHGVDVRLRRVGGRVKFGEYVGTGKRVRSDVQELTLNVADGISRLVRSVIRGVQSGMEE